MSQGNFNTDPQNWNGPGFQESQNPEGYETPPMSPRRTPPGTRSPPRGPIRISRVRNNNLSPIALNFEENSRRHVPLQLVNPPDPIPEIGPVKDSAGNFIKGNSYSGSCSICFEDIEGQACRVNCVSSHIFHCDCITEWTNTKKVLSDRYNDTCPLCREKITEMYYINIPKGFTSGFGRRKSKSRR